mgnify:CR=1 FL=1
MVLTVRLSLAKIEITKCLDLVSLFKLNFDRFFDPKFRFSNKISIISLAQNFDFRIKFRFWPNFDFRIKFRFWPIFDFGQISILAKFRFWPNFDFGQISIWAKFRFSQNFDFRQINYTILEQKSGLGVKIQKCFLCGFKINTRIYATKETKKNDS